MKLVADDSSLFIRVKDINFAHNQIVADLHTITIWANQWKMTFNPDITKKATEITFSSKYKKGTYPPLVFNGVPVARESSTKHLGVVLDDRLSFRKHIKEAIVKAKKGLALMKFLSKWVTSTILDKTYKLYVRPHLDYGDIIYDGQLIDMMHALESMQYQAGLIVSKCWKGTNRQKLYNELGWESLSERRVYRRFALYFKIINNETPEYLREHIHHLPNKRTLRYEKSFFPFCDLNWNNVDEKIRSASNLNLFKK